MSMLMPQPLAGALSGKTPASASAAALDFVSMEGVPESELQLIQSELTSENADESEENMRSRDEVALPAKHYHWEDRYQPRKPKYFNRIKTAYDWTTYNRTHYDRDNPPPRVVRMYKFNIFYPDLIDKTVTPRYYLEASTDPDYLVLRFHAGPPYEDIAFKIVNCEWDKNPRSGFRVTFDRGVLQLHFSLKRLWYRR